MFVLKKSAIVCALFVCLIAVVGFDISTNFLLPELGAIVSVVREALLWAAVLLLIRRLRYSGLVWCAALVNVSLELSFFYGPMYFYYPIRTVAVIFLVRSVYRDMEVAVQRVAILSLFVLFAFNIIFADRMLVDQGQRFFAANATVVSIICIYLLVNSRVFISGLGLVGGLLTGSFAFLISLVSFLGRRPFLIGLLAAAIVPLVLLYVQDTQSGGRLLDFIEALGNVDILALIESTTIGVRLDEFQWVVGGGFDSFLGASLANQPSDSGLESQILFFIAYGGAIGCLLVVLYGGLVWWKFYSTRKLSFFFCVVLLLYAVSIRIFESFATIFYLALTYEALYAEIRDSDVPPLLSSRGI